MSSRYEPPENHLTNWRYRKSDIENFKLNYADDLEELRQTIKRQHDTEPAPAASPQKPESSYFSEIGKKAKGVEKGNKPILIAVTQYMEDNPKSHDWTNGQIAKAFCKKHNKNSPREVLLEGIEWDIYCKGDEIISDGSDAYSKKLSKVVKTITYTTFLNTYIPKAKKTISIDIPR